MKLEGNKVTVALQPISGKSEFLLPEGTVKTNFQNLVSTNSKVEGSAIAIKSPTPAPAVSIKTAIVSTAIAPKAVPVAPILNIKPVGIVETKTNLVTATIPEIKTSVNPVAPIANIKPVGIVETPNPILSNIPTIKTPVAQTITSVKTKVYDDTSTLPNVNVWVDGKAVAGSDINGNVSLPNVNCESKVMFSFVGYKSQTYAAKDVPAKIVLQTDDMLDEVVIKNGYKAPTTDGTGKKPNNLWWLLLLFGVVIYGGYKYTVDKDTKKIIKTKI